MITSTITYTHGQQRFEGYLAVPEHTDALTPGVLVIHDWSGRNAFACAQAEALAELGYIGFAIDMYGHAAEGTTTEEKSALMQPLIEDRALLLARIMAAFDTLCAQPNVDASRIGAIGFCFGGLCALDLARSGAALRCAVTFHGLLNKPKDLPTQPIHANLLVLHGHDDPMTTASDINAFCAEMSALNVDWQLHVYSQTQHAFTNPLANNPTLGTVFQPRSARRAEQAMREFLNEQLQSTRTT